MQTVRKLILGLALALSLASSIGCTEQAEKSKATGKATIDSVTEAEKQVDLAEEQVKKQLDQLPKEN